MIIKSKEEEIEKKIKDRKKLTTEDFLEYKEIFGKPDRPSSAPSKPRSKPRKP